MHKFHKHEKRQFKRLTLTKTNMKLYFLIEIYILNTLKKND